MQRLIGISLRRRILVLSLSAITLVWVATAWHTYQDAKYELDEVLDAQLAQSATLLAAQAAHELDEIDTDHSPLLHKYSRHVAFQIWEEGQLRMHSANAPSRPLSTSEQGFTDSTVDGHRWRVFSTLDSSGTLLVQIAEQRHVRDRLAKEISGHLLYPLFIALPLLAGMLWLAIASGLRPLARLTGEVEQRRADNLAPIELASAPAEVRPLIDRLNGLFGRISAAMENERRFTSDAAHELRTPVAAIKAQAQVALGATDDSERQRALHGAITGCDRATHLIEQLLTLARLESVDAGSLQPCALRDKAARVMAEMVPQALERDVQLELTEGEEVTVRGLPALLAIMLRNVLDNAIRHTPAGSSVRVEVGVSDGRPSVTVIDNGTGVPEEELEKISRRFYRPLGTAASGSGLGLSIVCRIADIHRAELTFAANPEGQGLRVSIIFPAE